MKSLPFYLASSALLFAPLNADPGTHDRPAPIYELKPYEVSAHPTARPLHELSQPWSVIADDELEKIRSATLGDTLSWQPGISATHFTAGASRPVIRGQGGQRVRILANGVGSQDLSNTSADHAVGIDPLLAKQIEILRGPANLLYGGNAIGGAVNIVDGRIPTAMPTEITGVAVAEYQSVSEGKYFGFAADIPSDNWVFHLDGVLRDSNDYDTPSFTAEEHEEEEEEEHEEEGPAKSVANSFNEIKNGAIGVSHVDERGYIGASFSRLDSEYGVLTEHENRPFIDLEQNRFVIDGERKLDLDLFTQIRGSYAYSDYEHSEFEAPGELGTKFELKSHEWRIELDHAPIGSLEGILGLQLNSDETTTPTAESIFAGSGVNAIDNNRLALFAFEETELEEHLRWEIGARIEYSDYDVGGPAPTVRNRDFTLWSGSTALIYDLAEDYVLSGNLAYSERAPAAEELYSNGAHHGTESFNIGNDSLDIEDSVGIDLTLRRTAGLVTGEITAFYQHYDNFIFEQATGRSVSEEGEFPVPAGEESLRESRYVGVEAEFYGFEAHLETPLMRGHHSELILRLMADYTRARNESDNNNLPRIPPLRFGAELEYNYDHWQAGLEWRHAFEQEKFAPEETKTEDYSLLNVRGSYKLDLDHHHHNVVELFASVENVTDELAYLSTSFRKEKAPLPGRSFNVGLKYEF